MAETTIFPIGFVYFRKLKIVLQLVRNFSIYILEVNTFFIFSLYRSRKEKYCLNSNQYFFRRNLVEPIFLGGEIVLSLVDNRSILKIAVAQGGAKRCKAAQHTNTGYIYFNF